MVILRYLSVKILDLYFIFIHFLFGTDDYKISATKSLYETEKGHDVSIEWYFNFPESDALFIDIAIVDSVTNTALKLIAFTAANTSFVPYDSMKGRLSISKPIRDSLTQRGVRIVIPNVESRDGGYYRCMAVMRNGKIIESVARLVVLGN